MLMVANFSNILSPDFGPFLIYFSQWWMASRLARAECRAGCPAGSALLANSRAGWKVFACFAASRVFSLTRASRKHVRLRFWLHLCKEQWRSRKAEDICWQTFMELCNSSFIAIHTCGLIWNLNTFNAFIRFGLWLAHGQRIQIPPLIGKRAYLSPSAKFRLRLTNDRGRSEAGI